MGFSKQDRVTNPPGGTRRAVKGQAQGSLHLEEKDRSKCDLKTRRSTHPQPTYCTLRATLPPPPQGRAHVLLPTLTPEPP